MTVQEFIDQNDYLRLDSCPFCLYSYIVLDSNIDDIPVHLCRQRERSGVPYEECSVMDFCSCKLFLRKTEEEVLFKERNLTRVNLTTNMNTTIL